MPLDQLELGAAPNDGTGDGLRTAGGKINAAIAAIDTATGAITTLDGRVATVETGIATATGAITTLDGRVATVETGIATANGNIATLDGRVATVETGIATANGNIATLDGRVTAVEAKPGPLKAALAADFTTTSTVLVNVTGLTLTLTAGRWQIMGVYDLDPGGNSLAITAINGPTLTSLVLLRMGINSTSGALATGLVTGYDTNIDSASGGSADRVRSYIVGSLIVSAGGTLALRLRGTSGEITRIKAGSWITALALP
jgi:hypothetical protein